MEKSTAFLCRRILFTLLGAAALGIAATDLSAQSSNSSWQAQSIYQVITDRFYDGNTNNDNVEGTYAPNDPEGVHGGDFAGLQQKLDYIKALGATAIWISPIVLNTEGQYHGYSAWNFYEVAPHWGSITDLQNLVQAAHARGLKVIDDIVLNHAGDLVTGTGSTWPSYNYPTGYPLQYVNANQTYPAPFNVSAANPQLTNLWHNYGDIGDYNDPQQTVLGWLDGLNDLRTETPYVRTNLISIYEYWINQIGFDAFRVDTVLEVDHGCWQTFCPAIYAYTATNVPHGATVPNTNFFIFGEAWNGSESVVGLYTGTEDGGPYEFESTEDYPLYDDLSSVFATLSGPTAQIQAHYQAVQTNYDPTTWAQQVIFLDNQDNPRFLSSSESGNNTNALKTALAFLYSSIGIPCLYYGTEQGFNGTTDPDCREDMFAGEWKDGPGGVQSLSSPGVDNFNMTHPLFQWVAQLNNFRRLYPAMSLGAYVNHWYNSSGPGLFAYSRIWNTQEVFVVFNTDGYSQTLPACTVTYPAGTVLVNLLNTNETYTVAAGSQTPAIAVPSVSAKMFIARSQWLPLNPVVVSNSPIHWAADVLTYTPTVLQFSDSMNTNSVQAAFATVPPVTGAFSWTSTLLSNDTLIFTPTGAGLPPLTNITVSLTNTAFDAVTGKTLFAPYTLSFQSAAAVGPLVTITAPANHADFLPGATIALTVNASEYGNSRLTNVAYYANSALIGGNGSSPYGFSWKNVPGGSYALTAVASDALGNMATSAVVNVTVGPMVSLTAPANNASFNPGASIALTASAAETGSTITNVAFYANGGRIGSATVPPYAFTWDYVPGGSYALTAVAKDALGNTATSSVVNITLGPLVAIAAPANTACFSSGSSVSLEAVASEPGGAIANVAFYANGTLIGATASGPYTLALTNVPAGSYALTAVAEDYQGYAASSAVVTVTVAPTAASDAESNYTSWGYWAGGENAGTGFLPWVLEGGGEYYGFILNPSGSIDTGGNAWCLYANGSGTPYAYAFRALSNSLAPGAAFSVQFAGTSVSSPGSMGICLRNSSNVNLAGSSGAPPPVVTDSATCFAFYFAGGQSDYTVWDAAGASDSGIPFTSGGLLLQFSLVSSNTYRLLVLSAGDSSFLGAWSGTLAGAPEPPIQMFAGFNSDSGSYENDFFNSLWISAAGPVVTIATPVNGAAFSTATGVNLSASAADPGGAAITNVSYYANRSLIGSATSTPFNRAWTNLVAGSYALTAVAADAFGRSATSAVVNVTVTLQPQSLAINLTTNKVNLSWTGRLNTSYQVQCSTNLALASGGWSNLGSAILGNGSVQAASDSITNRPRRFYRLLMTPQ
jgi:glycosidase